MARVNCWSLPAKRTPTACSSQCEIRVPDWHLRLLSTSSRPSTRGSPTAWAWASRSAARLSKPMVGGCGRPGASRGVLSFSLRSPLTEPPSVIDVAYCEGLRMPAHDDGATHFGAGVRKPPREMLWGGGEDIASIVA